MFRRARSASADLAPVRKRSLRLLVRRKDRRQEVGPFRRAGTDFVQREILVHDQFFLSIGAKTEHDFDLVPLVFGAPTDFNA